MSEIDYKILLRQEFSQLQTAHEIATLLKGELVPCFDWPTTYICSNVIYVRTGMSIMTVESIMSSDTFLMDVVEAISLGENQDVNLAQCMNVCDGRVTLCETERCDMPGLNPVPDTLSPPRQHVRLDANGESGVATTDSTFVDRRTVMSESDTDEWVWLGIGVVTMLWCAAFLRNMVAISKKRRSVRILKNVLQ